jgi:phosphocarrier protein
LKKAEKCFEKLLIFGKNTVIIKILIFFILIFEETEMISLKVTINNSVGLHARPATFFIQKANSFKCSIWVEKEDCRVNAKSLLGVLSLGISNGTNITIIADGQDEQLAADALAALIDSGFEEV